MQFKDVIGQSPLKDRLIQGVQKNKVGHAQLFSGESGFGSLGIAIAYAQYLFCENKTKDDSCGQCASCTKIQDLQHPDLHFSFPSVQSISRTSDPLFADWRDQVRSQVYFSYYDWIRRIDVKERQSIISTEESSEIQKKLHLKSYEGNHKILIIWMAEKMNPTCSNNLLKILEEPPDKTVVLLVCNESDKLLDTIQSRCQMFPVLRLQDTEVIDYLQRTYQLSLEEAQALASLSEGNIIKANEFVDAGKDDLSLKDDFIQLMRSSYKKNVIDMMSWAENMSQKGKERQKIFLSYTLHMFRQCIAKNYVGPERVQTSKEELEFLNRFSPYINGKNIRQFMSTIDEAYYQLERNANSKILFTLMCFQTMRLLHKT